METAVCYSGEFVLTKSGSKDFGEIPPAVARRIRRQAGKIRLRRGRHVQGEKGNYGEAHIEREERLKDLANYGYQNARDFIETICQQYNEIYSHGVGLLLNWRTEKNIVAIIELEPSTDGDFYDVKTGYPARNKFLKQENLLWVKPKQ